MDALGVAMIAAGSWLVYAAVKGQHPWTMFGEALTGKPTTATAGASGLSTIQAGAASLAANPNPGPGLDQASAAAVAAAAAANGA